VTRALALMLACAAVLFASGCGEGGASAGATVSVYVSRPLCAAASAELAKAGGKAGDLRVRAVCLPAPGSSGRLDLARAGANARRATEDSTAVAFLEPPGPATKFTSSILEPPGIVLLVNDSGSEAMRETLRAISDADTSNLRASIRESLEEGP
jgi:hypothetical protein